MSDFVRVFNIMSPKNLHSVIVFDVAVNSFFRVISFQSNIWGKITLKIDSNDFSFMSNSTGEIVNVPTSRQQMPFRLNLLNVLADDSITDTEMYSQVTRRK